MSDLVRELRSVLGAGDERLSEVGRRLAERPHRGRRPLAALASVAAGAIAQEPVRIDFESFPDGRPACERCPVSDAYRRLGVEFAFFSPFTGETEPYLIGSGAYDPEGEEENHAITAALTEEGLRPGVIALRFPSRARRVQLRLRGSNAVRGFEVRAVGPDGDPLPADAVRSIRIRTYRASGGGAFREERVTVSWADGISSVELDGRGPPGHILLVDELTIWR